MQRVIVYGTLKRGHGLHCYLMDQKYIGVRDVPGIEVYCNGCFPYACLSPGAKLYPDTRKFIPNADAGTRLIGEVYEVDEATMYSLDMVEGEGQHYCRIQVKIDDEWTWIYIIDREYATTNTRYCPSGWWDDPEYIDYTDYGMDAQYIDAILDYYKSKIAELVMPENREDVMEYIEDMADALEVWE